MKAMKKNLMAVCAVLAVAASSVAIASFNPVSASAETTTAQATEFYMEEGAAVRTAEGELGIRFTSTITKSYWESLQATYGADATYEFYSVVTDGTTPITKKFGATPDFEESDAYEFYSTIVYTTAELEAAGLLDKACELKMSAQTYLEVTTAGSTEATKITAFGETGERCMKAVANAAVLAGEEDEDLAKYFTVGNRSTAVEGYAFADNTGVVTMAAMPTWTEDMEVYYGAQQLEATYANGTVSFVGVELPEGQTQAYISIFNGNTVYSAKVTEALKITQAQVDDGTLLKQIQTGTADAPACIYLASDISLAGLTWDPEAPFVGTFDGGNHTVDKLTTVYGSNASGFFRRFTGTLKNIAFTNVTLGANTGVIGDRFAENTQTFIDNVFIQVANTGNSSTSSRYGVFTERADKTAYVTVKNVVVSMPSKATKESLFGNSLKTTAYLTNVYTIGLKTTGKYPYTENSTINTTPVATNCGFYADLTAFNSASKTLTPFLTNCVANYLNATNA